MGNIGMVMFAIECMFFLSIAVGFVYMISRID